MNTETTTPETVAIREQLAAAIGGEAKLASFYTQRTMRDIDARARRELDDAASSCAAMLERVRAAIAREQLADYAQHDEVELIARFCRLWCAWQHAGSRVANWMVTGPAKFPVHTNNKRIATEDRRYDELKTFTAEAANRAVKRARAARAAALGVAGLAGEALVDARAKLAERERRQEWMKATNSAIRKGKLADGDGDKLVAVLAAAGHKMGAALAAQLLVADWSGRGFAAYQLSNNLAEIKRLQVRVRELEAKQRRAVEAEESDAPAPVEKFGEVELVRNAAIDRVQLVFPGKPDAEARALLKSNGFRWSPRESAWQRQLNEAGIWKAQTVAQKLAAA